MGKIKNSKNIKEQPSPKSQEEKETINMMSSENPNHNTKKQSMGQNTKR